MKRITLAPPIAIIATYLACYGLASIENLGWLWVVHQTLLVSLPLLAVIEIFSFSYDLAKIKGRILSCTYAPRLMVHTAGITLAFWILWITVVLIYLSKIE
jgi:hypothetical protein